MQIDAAGFHQVDEDSDANRKPQKSEERFPHGIGAGCGCW
jgi:hypothetical protein